MKGSEFVFDRVDLLYYKLHKISSNRGGSDTDSPKWSKKQQQQQYALTDVLNYQKMLYVPYSTEEIIHAYKSKHNLKHENQVIPLMITDGKKWHDLAVKKLSALLKGVT